MLKAYFDESHDEKEGVFCLGGYFGHEEEWGRLEKIWVDHTGDTPFHMTDCLSGNRGYKGVPEKERHDLIISLALEINNAEVYGFNSAVLLKHFRETFPKDKDDAPYFMCFQHCFNQAATWASEFREQVNCHFDRKKELEHRGLRIYEHVSGLSTLPGWEVTRWLGEIKFGSRSDYVPLQAADMLAYTGFRVLNDLLMGTRRDLWWVQTLDAKKRICGEIWDKERLIALRDELVRSKLAGVIPYVIRKKGEAR